MARTVSRYEKKRSVSRQSAVLGFALAALAINTGIDDEIMHVGKAFASVVGSAAEGLDANYRESKQNSMMPVQVAPESTVPPQDALVAEQPITALPPEVAPPVADASIPNDCIGGTYDGWYFDPRADEIIDTITQYTEDQRTFLKFSLRAVCEVVRQGNQINPSVEYVKSSVESNSGADSLSPYNNFHGHKAGKGDKFVEVWTREDYGQGIVRVKQKFTVYDTPTGSYEDSADMIQRLPWYEDAVACRYNNRNYALALQHQLNPVTCAIEKYQGQKGVLSYATQGSKPGEVEYEDILANRAEFLNVDQYIYRP